MTPLQEAIIDISVICAFGLAGYFISRMFRKKESKGYEVKDKGYPSTIVEYDDQKMYSDDEYSID